MERGSAGRGRVTTQLRGQVSSQALPACIPARAQHMESQDKPQWCSPGRTMGRGDAVHTEKAVFNPQTHLLRAPAALTFGACILQGKGVPLLPHCAERETEAQEGRVVCWEVKQQNEQLSRSSKRFSIHPVFPVHSQFLWQSLPDAAEPTHPLAGF